MKAMRKKMGSSTGLMLVWGFAAVLWLLTGVGVYSKTHSEEMLELEGINRANLNLARTLEEHTLRTLKSVDQAVLFLKFQYEKQGKKINIGDYVREGMIISSIFNQLGVIDEHGIYVLSNMPNHKQVDLSDREHFKVHIAADTNRLFISKPVLGRASGKWSIQMTRRINKPDGSFGGVVVVSLDPFYFTSLYSDVNLGANGVISLVGSDGVVRARQSGSSVDVGQSVADSKLFKQAARSPQGTYEAVSAVDGIERVYAYRKLPDFPLLVLIGVDKKEALAEFRDRASMYKGFGLLVAMAVLLFSLALTQLLRRQERIVMDLEESRKRAEEANRLKSEFLASMSHELRTPLNGIIGFAELLRESLDDESQRDFAATIENSGQHLLDLVNSILDLAKIEAGRMELMYSEQNCREIIANVHAAHLASAIQKEIDFSREVSTDVPELMYCDRMRLLQVLNNLVHNAIKFTTQGSVTLSLSIADNRLHFMVKDSGPGIPLEVQGAIFEKFRQGHGFITREHGGAGLGLALSKHLVELMGGRITLYSQPGVGSEFSFSLPLQAPTAIALPAPTAAAA